MNKETEENTIVIHNADLLRVGAVCKNMRQAQGLSQMNLALNADVSQGRVAYLEKGYPEVGLDKVIQIFQELGYTLDIVLRKTDGNFEKQQT